MQMIWATHVIGGIAVGTLVSINPVGLAVAGASALLPDIDKTGTKIGNRFPAVSTVVSIIFGHRGFTHSLLAAGIFYYLVMYIAPEYAIYAGVGYLSHLVLDTLNPMGVPWLWPIPLRFRIPLVRTGSVLDYAVMGLMLFYTTRYIFFT